MSSHDDKYDAKLCPNRLGLRKHLHDRVRWSARRDVVIGRLDLHDHIADTATDEEGFKALLTQYPDDLDRGIRFHPAMIPSSSGGAMPFRGVDFYRIDDLLSEE